MNTLVAEYWIWLVVALIIGLIVAWYVFHASRKTNVTGTSRDVLDDGADRAERNRALIDSAPAATRDPAPNAAAEPETIVPVAAPTGLGGTGAAVAAAADEAEYTHAKEADTPAETERTATTTTETVSSGVPSDDANELTRLKGVGPKLALRLNELGITSIAQIAEWDDVDIDRIDPELGRFQGRIRRDAWVEQARLLTSGETGAYQDKFGRLD
ncbi:hypothetical protein E3U23_00135 [Erythrobacter litoralis]|uniref:helix-hairpin-helix domain-containing protein n=1 Tax=Erythrobacter litoralis TaxID=39960 RepID=UPI002435D149|nr:helix-hairpin-helix domain-containing protein [Erythrobacter litoralis]MDG6077605.1 hypothetical protein [Erythrobacter litoralis]